LSAFNVAAFATSIIGGFLCSYVADRFGRKAGLAGGIIFSIGGIVGELASVSRTPFLLSKMILGLGLGFYLTIGAMYCSEVSVECFSILIPISLTLFSSHLSFSVASQLQVSTLP
jgi:MFS family permease